MSEIISPLTAFLHWEQKTPDNLFLRQIVENGHKDRTFREAGNEIRRIAAAITSLNYPTKSHIALLSKNCAEWIMADLAIMLAGHVSIPIYPTLGPETIQLILEHSESKAIFVGKLDNFESQKSGIKNIHTIGMDAYGTKGDATWEELLAQNEAAEEVPEESKDDLLSIMYTSGTTGKPKGVMHTIGNIDSTIKTAIDIIPLPEHARFFSYLPLSHVAERVAVEFHGIYRGVSFTFPHSLETFPNDLNHTKPHLFFAVPRIWSKFQEKILEKMPQKKLSRLLSIPFIGGLVKRKIVDKLGLNEATFIASGAAPIATSLQEWFGKLGVTIHQCYGMTEDCILSHYNLPGSNKFGTVGRAVPGVTGKLAEDGEIRIMSDVLMKGYYKEPELTAEIFDEEGYLKTGDLGEYDHDGYLAITGRVKDQFKTDKGKYISPGPIELELLKNTDIDQVCVVGMGIPQPIALIIASAEAKNKDQQEFISGLEASIEEVNPSLEKHEQLQKAVVMKEDWTIDNGLLTPTLKVKRSQAEKIHMGFYKSWFDMEDKVIFEK